MSIAKLLFTTILLTCLPLAAFAAAGQVAAMGGLVTAAGSSGQTVVLHKGDAVNKGDVITTDANSWVVLSMEDGASLTLRPKAKLRIVDYVYDPDNPQNGRSWLTLLQGALRSVTGAIGKLNHASYQLTTPTATIGIRGTDYDVDVVPDGNSEGFAPGTYHTVHAGGTVFKGQDGQSINVKPSQDVFTGSGSPHPRRMQARQRSVWTDIGNFDFKEKISGVLDDLHQRINGGYTLNLQKLNRGRDQVQRYLDRHPDEAARRGLLQSAGRQAAPESAMQSRLQHGKWHPGEPYFAPGSPESGNPNKHHGTSQQQRYKEPRESEKHGSGNK